MTRNRATHRRSRQILKLSQPRRRSRPLRLERLEARQLLASDWQNPYLPTDLNDDGRATPGDALVGINELNRLRLIDGAQRLPPRADYPFAAYYDVNGDGLLTSLDVLRVINALNNDPQPPTVVARLETDTAISGTNSDGVTREAAIIGTVQDLHTGVASLTARLDGGPMLTIPVGRRGEFRIQPNLALDGSADGPHLLEFIARDYQENASAPLQVSFVLDRTPVQGQWQLASSSDTGTRNDDRITRIKAPTWNVTTETGTRVEFFLGSTALGQATATAGIASFTVPFDLADGTYPFSARLTDSAGNVTTLPDLSVQIDTARPLVVESPSGLLTGSIQSLTVRFSEPPELNDGARFELRHASGPSAGQLVLPLSATRHPVDPRAVDLLFQSPLADGDYRLSLATTDLAGNSLAGTTEFTFAIADLPRLASLSPQADEQMVSVARETIVRFTEPVDPATITTESLQVWALGQPLAARRMVSSTERFVTIFYDQPLPAAAEVQVRINGDLIRSRRGTAFDADRNGLPGGQYQYAFRTLPLTRIPGTNVFGYVRDSFTHAPIVGATIRVDAFPEANVVTDANGRFELKDMPAPDFFVHIDGSTALNAPDGFVYPNVGKPFHSVPGQTVQLEMDGATFDVYLPPMSAGDIQPLSMQQETAVGFGPAGLAALAEMFPDVAPAMFERMEVRIAPGAAVDEQGRAGSQATVIPVPPEYIPAPLPPNLTTPLVVSIQTPGATNFDVPAGVSFPNLDGLAPGERTLILSFDHDAGRWVTNGTATVSADGLSIVSDPGAGIVAPGWHVTQQGTEPDIWFQPTIPAPDRDDDGEPDVPDQDDDNDGTPDLEEPPTEDEEGEYLITVTIDGGTKLKPPVFELLAGLDIPNVIVGLPGEDRLTIGYQADWKPFGDERKGRDFSFTFDFRVSEFWADLIPEVSLSLPHAEFGASASAGVGIAGVIDITGGESELEFDDIEIRPGNIQVEFSFQLQNSFLCHLPFDIGETICANRSLPFTLFGPPNVKLEEVSLPLGRVALVDYNANFFVGLSASVATSVTVAPKVQIRKQRISGGAGEGDDFEGEPGTSTAIPSFTNVANLETDSRVRLLFELENGAKIYTDAAALAQRNIVLPPETDFTLYAFAAATNRTAVFSGTTGPNGSRFSQLIPMTQIGGFDLDGDGLSDLAEQVLGTNIDSTDSDNDGILDLAELEQGLNPLDNRGYPTGVIASLSLPGQAKEVVLQGTADRPGEQWAYVATGSHGLAIIDASRFNNPILLGQLDLAGDATDLAVDPSSQQVAVAAGSAGLHLVDVSDPRLPRWVRTLRTVTNQVEVVDGIAYVTNGGQLQAYDLVTGELLEQLTISDGNLTGLAREARRLVTMDDRRQLRVIELSQNGMELRGQTTLQHGAGRLFVGGGIAYVAASSYFRGGFATVDLTNPDQPLVLSESDVVSPFISPQTMAIANGSGRALLIGQPGSQGVVDLLDSTDLRETNRLITRFNIAGTPQGVAIGSGIAFVASGAAGLQVVNFLPFDSARQAPTVQLQTSAIDLDSQAPGIQVQEETVVAILNTIRDDVQVRSVELLLDGESIMTDVSFPFDFSVFVPSRTAQRQTVTFQLRVTDTGGNVGLSEITTLQILPDVFAPTLRAVTPAEGGRRFAGHQTVRLRFSEPMDPATLTGQTLRLVATSAPQTLLLPEQIQFRQEGQEVQLTYAPLSVGDYQLTIESSNVRDRAGNPLAGDAQVINFSVIEDRDPGDTLATALDLGTLDTVFVLEDRIGQDDLGNPDPSDLLRIRLAVPRELRIDLTDRTDGSQIRILADLNGNGQIDSNEEIRQVGTGSASNLKLIQRLEAGEYLIEVRRWFPDDITPYKLTLSPSTPVVLTTPRDPGQTLATALDTGLLTTEAVSYRDIYGVRDQSDYYRFTIDQPREVQIAFADRGEGGWMRLIADLDADGVVDGGEQLREAGTSGSANLGITQKLEAGAYFVEVRHYYLGNISPYTLTLTPGAVIVPTTPQEPGQTLATALNVGLLTTAAVSWRDMYGVRDLSDYYRFTIDQPREVQIAFADRGEGGWMRLIADLDADGVVDGGEQLRDAGTSGSANVGITQKLEAGDYFVEVRHYYFGNISPYTLTLTPGAVIVPTTPQDPGQTLATALNVGLLTTAAVSSRDMYGVRDLSDYYRFTIDQPREVQITFADRGEGGWMRLIADLDADGVIDNGEQLRDTGTSGSANVGITQKLEAGDYFIEVRYYYFGNISPYTLTLTPGAVIVPTTPQDPGQTLATALNVGLLTTAAVSSRDMYGVRDLSDYYRFTIDQPREVQITFANRGEGGWMRLIADLDADGVIDGGEQLRDTGTSGSANVGITQKLEAGDYFVEVRHYYFGNISPYTLTLTPGAVIVPTTPQDPGQTLATALNVGLLTTAAVSSRDMYGVRDLSDFYRFTIDQPREVQIALADRGEGGWMRLIADLDADGVIDGGEQLRDTGTSGSANVGITQKLEAGDYFVEVRHYYFGNISPYTLSLTPGAVIVSTTPQDPGQTLATAFAIGPLSTTSIVYSDLYGVRDTLDVYRFEVTVAGQVRLHLTGRSAGGWMRLISDANGNGTTEGSEVLRDTSTSTTNDLQILLTLSVGTYFVEVRHYNFGDITPYTLSAVRVAS